MNFAMFALPKLDSLDLTLHQKLVLTVRRHPDQRRTFDILAFTMPAWAVFLCVF